MTTPLFEKYRPTTFEQIKGQDLAVAKLKAFVHTFSPLVTKKKAILLYGTAGTGKTTLAHVLANEMNYEIFELNASDLRNRAKLEEVMAPSTQQKSLFAKGKIILVDEVDGVTATDRGGLPELIALIEKTKFPIVITANDIWQQKFSLLRNKTELVALKPLDNRTVSNLLQQIIQTESKVIKPEILEEIITKSKGDLRAAINDLQSIIHIKPEESTLQGHIGEREKTKDIFHALKEVFKSSITKKTPQTFDDVDLELDQIMLWLEKNIPKEYSAQSLANAIDSLSKADVFRGRIHRQQHWRFLVYQNFLLSAGVASASTIKNPNGFTKYEKPTRILKIWMANQKNAKKKSIATKYAEYAHISKKRALKEFFIIALTINPNNSNLINQKLQLSDQELEFLREYQGALKVSHGLNKFAL